MNQQQQALKVLIEGIQLANKRGAFELQESVQLGQAVAVFTNPPSEANDAEVKDTPKENIKEETPKKTSKQN